MLRIILSLSTAIFFLIPAANAQKEIKKIHKFWKKTFNQRNFQKLSESSYINTAMVNFSAQEEYLLNVFSTEFNNLSADVSKIKRLKSRNSITNKWGHVLDIGHFKDVSGDEYVYLAAFRQMENEHRIEVHFITKKSHNVTKDVEAIDHLRTLWEEYSNTHQPSKLLDQTYFQDAVYFNNGMIYNGISEIKPKYKYMAKPTWKIKLYPEAVVPVSDTKIFEIGSYVSSGQGLYILVWEKRGDVWKISFDFNF